MLKDDVALYSKLTGNDGMNTPIAIIGAYLDGYDKGKAEQPKTGKWKNIVDGIEYTWGTCDSCGARIPMPYKYYKYCHNCGMKNEVTDGRY